LRVVRWIGRATNFEIIDDFLSLEEALEVLNSIDHLLGFIEFPDEEQAGDDLADTAAVVMAKGDASMLELRGS
jgi:hypothetical protein